MDITLRPSSLALEGYPHDLSTPGTPPVEVQKEVRSHGCHLAPLPGLSPPRPASWAVPGQAYPSLQEEGQESSGSVTGSRPSLPLVPIPATVPSFLGGVLFTRSVSAQ